ncbi:MAG TPA: nuclear transport factor 2 family protein [Bordetella sp.]
MMSDTLMSCHNQVMGLFRDLDENRYESLAARFAPAGVWHRQGKILQGRQAIVQALNLRSRTQRIHHLIVNLVADRADSGRCALRGYMLVVRYDGGSPLAGPAPLSGIENIRTTHIELSKSDGQWLVEQMRNDDPTFAAA